MDYQNGEGWLTEAMKGQPWIWLQQVAPLSRQSVSPGRWIECARCSLRRVVHTHTYIYMCMHTFTPDRQAGGIACVHIHIYTHTYNALWRVHTLYWQACQDQVTLVTVNVCRYTHLPWYHLVSGTSLLGPLLLQRTALQQLHSLKNANTVRSYTCIYSIASV